eukprot:2706712-Rhodomonas_salina.3
MRMLAARGELGSRRSAAVTLQAAVRAKVGAQAGEEERRKQAARRLQVLLPSTPPNARCDRQPHSWC